MQEKLSQDKPEGNTRTSGPKNQYYRWFFTYHIEENELKAKEANLFNTLKDIAKQFTFQAEKGAGGAIHFQGCFSLERKEYLQGCKNLFGVNTIHLEPCKDWYASRNYCSKADTCIGRKWNETDTYIDIPELKNEWAKDLKDILINTEPDDRSILWYYDVKGGAGKTEFVKHMLLSRDDVFACRNAKSADIACAIKNHPKIVLMDLPRTIEGYVNYNIIEQLKDGMVFSSKYKSGMIVFNRPHIVVLANFKPDTATISADRWRIVEL